MVNRVITISRYETLDSDIADGNSFCIMVKWSLTAFDS